MIQTGAAARAAAGCALLGFILAADVSAAQTLNVAEMKQLDTLSASLDQRVDFVVDQYGGETLISGLGEMERAFGEAEIRFLLEDYNAATVFLYGLVEKDVFKASRDYPLALRYLAESLYQVESYRPSRSFFIQYLELNTGAPERQLALVRLIELSSRLGDLSSVDRYLDALRASGERPSAEVLYVYGKFTFERKDLDPTERVKRALDAFNEVPDGSAFDLQSRFFMGTLYVQSGDLESAEGAFRSMVRRPAKSAADKAVQELAWLALGRVYYETGRLDEAIDAYQRVSRSSEQFYQSLYEIAWTYVKRKDFENALRACEIILVGAYDTPLAPEATILQGNLLAKSREYDKAIDTYIQVINEYAPVRDEIDALLSLHDDPVRYFNELISREGDTFEVDSILPPVAVKWASTEDDVKQAMHIVATIKAGTRDVAEGKQIGDRILASLDAGTLEPFPQLAEGHARSLELQNSVLTLQSLIARGEQKLVGSRAPDALRAEYERARRRREDLEFRFKELPTNEDELAVRIETKLRRVSEVGKTAYRQRQGASGLNAMIAAIHKYVRDTQPDADWTPEEIDEFLAELRRWKDVADDLGKEAQGFIRETSRLRDAVQAGTLSGDEDDLRAQYGDAVAEERVIASKLRSYVGSDGRAQLDVLDRHYGRSKVMLDKLTDLSRKLQSRARERRAELRAQVLAEVDRITGYGGQVNAAMGDTKNLVGQIALGSFRRVQEAFYTLILKADVGIVDVAWSKKADNSKEIQRLAQEKDHMLRLLDKDFREVLQDTDG